MNCPFCKHSDSRVLDSRPGADGRSIRRRRECESCAKRWKTIERTDLEMPMVVKRNRTFQPFDREKLRASMQVACGKRPVAVGQIDKIISDIEWSVLQSGKESITTQEIGEEVMRALKGVDEIAYIRYASVYKRFQDVEDMLTGMRDLLEEQKESPA